MQSWELKTGINLNWFKKRISCKVLTEFHQLNRNLLIKDKTVAWKLEEYNILLIFAVT